MIASAKEFVAWVTFAVIVGVIFYVVQTRVVEHSALNAFQSYMDCLQKVGTYDWGKVPGGKPGSSSEICNNVSRTRM